MELDWSYAKKTVLRTMLPSFGKMSWKISLDIEIENARLTWKQLKVVAKDLDILFHWKQEDIAAVVVEQTFNEKYN